MVKDGKGENGKAKMEEKQIQSGGWWLAWQAVGVGGGEDENERGENEAKLRQQKGKQNKKGKKRKKC